MTTSARLQQLRNQIEGWRGQFAARRDPPWELSHVTKLVVLITEAKEVVRKSLGTNSAFYTSIPTFWIGSGGAQRQPDDGEIRQCLLLIDAAVRDIQSEERSAQNIAPTRVHTSTAPYVSEQTISELRGLPATKHDFTRLSELCRELNVAAAGEAHMASMMLVRSIIDHIPPAMGEFKTFKEFSAQYKGTRSFKEHMVNFDQLFRKSADSHLHTHIRLRESVPTAEEANYRNSLGELLREVVRVNRSE